MNVCRHHRLSHQVWNSYSAIWQRIDTCWLQNICLWASSFFPFTIIAFKSSPSNQCASAADEYNQQQYQASNRGVFEDMSGLTDMPGSRWEWLTSCVGEARRFIHQGTLVFMQIVLIHVCVLSSFVFICWSLVCLVLTGMCTLTLKVGVFFEFFNILSRAMDQRGGKKLISW